MIVKNTDLTVQKSHSVSRRIGITFVQTVALYCKWRPGIVSDKKIVILSIRDNTALKRGNLIMLTLLTIASFSLKTFFWRFTTF